MPNLAAPFKSAVLAQFPNATIVERGRNFIKHQVAANRYVLDSTLSSIHYFEGEAWQESNTDWADPDDVNFTDMCKTIGPFVYSDGSGKRRIYPRRGVLTEFVEFARPQFWTGTAWQNLVVGTRTRTGDTLLWDRAHFSVSLKLGGSQCKVEVVLKDAQAANRVRWPVTLTGLSLSGWTLVSTNDAATVLEMHQPWMVDANGANGVVSASFVNGAVEFNADLTGLTFPITIDPTVDVQPGASANDGYVIENTDTGGYTDVRVLCQAAGTSNSRQHGLIRFPNIAVPQGATINAGTKFGAYFDVNFWPNIAGDVYCEAADNSVNLITNGAIFARSRTTATVSWTGTVTTTGIYYYPPDINAAVSEVVARVGWASGNALSVIVLGKNQGTSATFFFQAYDQSTTNCSTLHIDYTAAAAGGLPSKPRLGNQAVRRASTW